MTYLVTAAHIVKGIENREGGKSAYIRLNTLNIGAVSFLWRRTTSALPANVRFVDVDLACEQIAIFGEHGPDLPEHPPRNADSNAGVGTLFLQ